MSKTASEWTEEGIAFKNSKNMQKAMECFDQAITTDPTFGKAYYWKAFINDNDSKLAEEVELYDKAIANGYNQDYMVFYCLGVTLSKLKRKADAVSAYEKSHALNPNHFSSFNNKGNVLMVLGRIEEAVEAFKISIKIKPSRLDAYEGLGPLLEDLGQREEALRYYDEGLKVNPTDLMVNLSKGTLLTEMGRYDEAISCFKAALMTNANAIVTNYRLGNVYTAIGDIEQANKYYTVTTNQNPTGSWGFCVRGQCFYRLGKKTEAFEDFKKTKEMFAKEEGLLNWTPKQVKFIKDTLTSLLDAEDASGETIQMMKTINQANPAIQKFITKMKQLVQEKNKTQDSVVNQMAKRANDETENKLSELDKIKEEFKRNIELMQAENNNTSSMNKNASEEAIVRKNSKNMQKAIECFDQQGNQNTQTSPDEKTPVSPARSACCNMF